jgi:nicotinic acid mononucleotide adenylyltransferase
MASCGSTDGTLEHAWNAREAFINSVHHFRASSVDIYFSVGADLYAKIKKWVYVRDVKSGFFLLLIRMIF